ncbi:MAG: hypothetical protein HOP15_02590, partial [Planctomycetes bacterium]|nr:hypothetical protein [Planctomycetota bacterium]
MTFLWHESRLVLSVLAVLSLLAPDTSAQDRRLNVPLARPLGKNALAPTVFEGFVLEPDGDPAAGAVVVSSAGGKAVTDWSGNFRFEVCVPVEAESIQITAVAAGGTSLTASSSVLLPAPFGPVRVGPLLLAQGLPCSPRFLPTFGGEPGTNGDVHAWAVFDDGGGPTLYAGGYF